MSIEHNFYAGGGLDRVSHLRDDAAWVAARLADPRSRILPLWGDQSLFLAPDGGSAPLRPAIPALAELDGPLAGLLGRPEAALTFLGLDDGIAYFAADFSPLGDQPAAQALLGGEFADLRRHGPLLEGRAAALLAYARGLIYWHSRHRFCGVCGSPTLSLAAGHQRRCSNPSCQAVVFPRTDPVVIMLVLDGERCLLGRQAVWPAGFHSALAGFVEPGESLEEAVAREVLEESGVKVADVRYHSSQPWPFPGSLMLGFFADAATTEIIVNRSELEDARWFGRAELLAAPDNSERLRLPPRAAIARRLVDSWLGRG